MQKQIMVENNQLPPELQRAIAETELHLAFRFFSSKDRPSTRRHKNGCHERYYGQTGLIIGFFVAPKYV
jgi:hypothetical protein